MQRHCSVGGIEQASVCKPTVTKLSQYFAIFDHLWPLLHPIKLHCSYPSFLHLPFSSYSPAIPSEPGLLPMSHKWERTSSSATLFYLCSNMWSLTTLTCCAASECAAMSWKTKIHDVPMKDECCYLVAAVLSTCLLYNTWMVVLLTVWLLYRYKYGSGDTSNPPVSPGQISMNEWLVKEFDPQQTPGCLLICLLIQ